MRQIARTDPILPGDLCSVLSWPDVDCAVIVEPLPQRQSPLCCLLSLHDRQPHRSSVTGGPTRRSA